MNLAIERLREVGVAMSADDAWKDILLEGPEVLGVEALDVGIVRVRVVARVRASDQWSAGRELRLRIASGLAEAGITPLMPMLVPGAGELAQPPPSPPAHLPSLDRPRPRPEPVGSAADLTARPG